MKAYIGIDVGKYELDLYDGKVHIKFTNDEAGIKKIIKHLAKQENIFVVYEATGGYEQLLSSLLSMKGIAYKRVHPNKVRHYAKSLGYLAKTDKIDAKLLSLFGEHQKLSESDQPLDEKVAELKALLVRREQLLEEKVREGNRLDKVIDSFSRSSIKAHLQWLQAQIKAIEEQAKAYVKAHPCLQASIGLYQSIKGIGFLTAGFLVTHLPELGQIEHRPLSALVGVAPMNTDSGRKTGKRKVQAGRAGIRKILYMATLSAIRSNKDIKAFYNHLIQKGKTFKVAITAAMRKLIIVVNCVAKRGTPWQENFKQI